MEKITMNLLKSFTTFVNPSLREDLSQQASLLELEASAKFLGPKNGRNWETFLEKSIKGGLIAFVEGEGDISIPAATRYAYMIIIKSYDQFKAEHGYAPSYQMLAEMHNCGIRKIANAMNARVLLMPAHRLDAAINVNDENPTSFGEMIPDSAPSPEQQCIRDSLNNRARDIFLSVSGENKIIIQHLLAGLGNDRIAQALGVSEREAQRKKMRLFSMLRRNPELRDIYSKIA